MKQEIVDVSILIVNWNTGELLSNCIHSIADRTHGVNYEIIVVDNASTDGSAEMVRDRFPSAKLVESKENLGFVRGNNRALEEARGKYVLYLNPDTELKTNAVYGVASFLDANGEYGAAGCKILNADGSVQFTCARTFPSPFKQFCLLTLLNRLFPESRFFSTVEMTYWDHSDSREIDCLSGAFMMVRKSLIDELQGFDENLFMYAEDVDLCFRIKGKGKKVYYLAAEEIYHFEGTGSRKNPDPHFSAILQRESNHYFIRKHFGAVAGRRFKTAIFVGSVIRLAIMIFLIPYFWIFPNKGDRSITNIIDKYYNLLLWSVGRRRFQVYKAVQ
jgi:O-antigen biosynthesis protein